MYIARTNNQIVAKGNSWTKVYERASRISHDFVIEWIGSRDVLQLRCIRALRREYRELINGDYMSPSRGAAVEGINEAELLDFMFKNKLPYADSRLEAMKALGKIQMIESKLDKKITSTRRAGLAK